MQKYDEFFKHSRQLGGQFISIIPTEWPLDDVEVLYCVVLGLIQQCSESRRFKMCFIVRQSFSDL